MPAKPKERCYRAMAQPLFVPKVDLDITLEPIDDPNAVQEHMEPPAKRIETDFYVEGYATTFDDPYLLWEDPETGAKYYEIVDSHALDRADMSDIIMQYDHTGFVYARNRNGSLVAEPDSHGLFMAADLGLTTRAREDLYEPIDMGLVDRMSWAFTVESEEWEEDPANNVFTCRITAVKKVFDVSAVSLPCDPNTEISARALIDGVIERRRLRETQQRAARVRKEVALRAKAMKFRH